MPVKDDPSPTNGGPGSVNTDLSKDPVQPMEDMPEPTGDVVARMNGVKCSTCSKDSRRPTYRVNIVDGKRRDDHRYSHPHRAQRPAVTFNQLLAKYEKLGRMTIRRAQHRKIADTDGAGSTCGHPMGPKDQCPVLLFCIKEGFPLP